MKPEVTRGPVGESRHQRRNWLAALIWLAVPATLLAQPSHTYFIPVPEDQIRTWAVAIDQGALGVSDDIHTVISLTATLDSTVLYYDHWEDGFEYDLANPVQLTTEVWGDQDCGNGFTPLLGACTPGIDDALDVTLGGDVIALENDVPANPRNPSAKYWDGGDKVGSSNLLAVTRAAWPTVVGVQSGVVLAGAVEVYAVTDWDTAFESPVGEDIDTSEMFEYTALAIMAQANNTFVEVDTDDDGTVDVSQWLQQGESLLAETIRVGATVEATQPVQVDIMTGDVDTTYEARWFGLVPTAQWSDTYYSPVGETNDSAPVTVIAYNPANSGITIDYETLSGSGSFISPAGGVYEFTMPANSGAQFAATGISLDLPSSKDTWISHEFNGFNYGACTEIKIDREESKPERSLLHFDVSSIPVGATIVSADLILTKLSGNTDIDISALRVTSDWDEGTQCGSSGAASWKDRQSTTPWTTTGGDYDPTVIDTLNIGANGPYAWNVASLVQDWVDGTYTNFGFMLKVEPESGGDRDQAFASRDNPIAGHRPRLVVSYVEVEAPQRAGTYSDEFDADVWDGSDGTFDWSTKPWVDNDSSGNGPTSGDIRAVQNQADCHPDSNGRNCLQLKAKNPRRLHLPRRGSEQLCRSDPVVRLQQPS